MFQNDSEWLRDYLVNVLERETQPSVRFLAEWSLVRLAVHCSTLQTFILNVLTQVCMRRCFVHLHSVTPAILLYCTKLLTARGRVYFKRGVQPKYGVKNEKCGVQD